ncbi:MAG: sigma-70 family RNA polymerase sigma factor [Acidimicrobiaceae bacterium]|nr:sigma-70 family RNA polymerase sigma factor [Acidimicrobiaceae bacterium]
MPSCASALLNDWELLQAEVMPPLLALDQTRAPAALVIGSPLDGLSVALAYAQAGLAGSPDAGSLCRAEGLPIAVFVPGAQHAEEAAAEIPAREVRRLPRAIREACLVKRDGRWVVRPWVARRVILGNPPQPVDLVTWRPGDADVDGAVRRLKVGGYLFLAEAPAPSLPAGLAPLDGQGRVFRKEAETAGRDGQDRPGEERVTLARRQLEAELIDAHMGLARSLTRRFVRRVDSLDDLEQVASLALVKAARRYDPARGTPFASFAAVSVIGELKRHLRDTSWALRVPRSVKERYLVVKRTQEELGHQLGQSPSIPQIADTLGATEEEVLEAIEAGDSYWPLSLDTGSDTGGTRDVPVNDRALDRSLEIHELQRFLPRLEARDQLILRRLYFDGYTQQQVAEEIGTSQMQVSRLNRQMLLRLREWLSG